MVPRMSKPFGPPLPPPPPPLLAGPPPEAQDTFLYLIYQYSHGGLHTYSFHKIDPCDGRSSDDDVKVKPLPPPLFYLDVKRYPIYMGFLTLGPQILMFGGMYLTDTGRSTPDGSSPDGSSRDVFVYDTTKKHSVGEDPANFLTNLPQMLAPKFLPIVFTVAGKIYVLSSNISQDDLSPTFEAFDMEAQSWSPLHELPRAHGSHGEYEIRAYGIHESTIVVLIPMGMFMFDVTNQAQWKEVTTLGGVNRLPFYGEYIDGLWYALDAAGLSAYDFISPIGLRNTWFTPTRNHFELLRRFRRSLVFRVGCQTVGLASSGLKCEYGEPYIVLELSVYSKRARTNFLFPIHRHVLKFVMQDCPLGDWGEVRACFAMQDGPDGMHLAKSKTATEEWNYLENLYIAQSNFSKRYELETVIRIEGQNNRSIQEFYNFMNDIWDRLDMMDPSELQTVAAYQKVREEQKLVQFLMALRSEFEQLRASILHRAPLPTLHKVVSELVAEETRLKTPSPATMNTQAAPHTRPPNKDSSFQGGQRIAIDECPKKNKNTLTYSIDQTMSKCPQSSSQPPEAQDTLVYLVYEHFGGAPFSYSLYMIDLCGGSSGIDDVKPLPPPFLELDGAIFPHGMRFLNLEQQRILMLGGSLSRKVSVYDTLTESFIRFPEMLGGKLCPIVLRIGEKIFVLSDSFNPYHSYNPSPRFEVFDMEIQSWHALPEPCFPPDPAPARADNYEILAYAVHDSTIIVSMPIGIFMYNVAGEVGWRMVTTLGGVDRLPFCQGAEFMNGLLYALEGDRLHAYHPESIHGLKCPHDVFSMECGSEYDFEPKKNLVFSMGRDRLGVVRSSLENPPRQSRHIIFHLLEVAHSKDLKPLLPFDHHPMTFLMKDRPYARGAVAACFPIFSFGPELECISMETSNTRHKYPNFIDARVTKPQC